MSELNFNEKLFKRGQTVAVALSGGKDSVCLLDVLLDNAARLSLTVKAINVDHSIRGTASVSDSEFVKDLCEKRNVKLFFKKVDCPAFCKENSLSEEEGARILRYRAFYEAVNSGFSDLVATAHHLSDNAETVLFNLFRGVSPSGAAGIKKISDDGKIIRPLLEVSREEIDAYASSRKLGFVTDESNLSSAYSRNYIRLNLMPLIKEKFPAAERAMGRFADISEKQNSFISSLAEKELICTDGEISISPKLAEVVFSRAAVLALNRIGIKKDYEKRHIDALIDLSHSENGTRIDLPQGVVAVNDYGKITLYRPRAEDFGERKFDTGEYFCGDEKIVFEKGAVENPAACRKDERGTLFFDADKIPPTATIRTRKAGDVFSKFGGGTKKLKDYLIDIKIPERKRGGLLLVADGKNVLVICGVEISESVKTDENTVNVIKCYTIKR